MGQVFSNHILVATWVSTLNGNKFTDGLVYLKCHAKLLSKFPSPKELNRVALPNLTSMTSPDDSLDSVLNQSPSTDRGFASQ